MEGAAGTTLQLDEIDGPKSLLVYCGGEGEEKEAPPADQTPEDLQLVADLDLHLPLALENDEDTLWLVGQLGVSATEDAPEDTLLLGGSEVHGGERSLLEEALLEGSLLEGEEEETLLLLSEEISLLPFTQELPITQDTLVGGGKEGGNTDVTLVQLPVSTGCKEASASTMPPKQYQIKVVKQPGQCEADSRRPSRLETALHTPTPPKTYSRASTTKPSRAPLIQSSASSANFKPHCQSLVEKPRVMLQHSPPQCVAKLSPSTKLRDTEKPEVKPAILPQRKKGQQSYGVKVKLAACSKSSIDEDELSEEPFVGPSVRWPTQPKSYRGAKARDGSVFRKTIRKVPPRVDTDGETSGMGSSVDEPVESSTESASEAPPTPATPFLPPRTSSSSSTSSPRSLTTSPTAVKKRRGGWPKGRKRKPELPVVKPPKAPLTAYVLFLNERRKYYRETRPDLRFGAVTKLLGAEWSSLTAEQKAAFVTRSEQDKRRYRNELQAYRQSHDYQLLLRKKRIKNVIRRGGTTTEESSDFTDEIDDDDSEELYCRICDQLFTSLHNKREHLYGKQHLQAITGEYQRERLAEEERQMAAGVPLAVVGGGGGVAGVGRGSRAGSCLCKSHGAHKTQGPRTGLCRIPGVCPACCTAPRTPRIQDEEHDGDEEDEEEEEEEEDEEREEEEEEEEEEKVATAPVRGITSMADTLEGVMAKVLEREKEIAALERSREAARARNLQLAGGLLRLRERSQGLEGHCAHLRAENAQLKAEADVLWMLPALFGVTPLQMVDITLREQQQGGAEEQGQRQQGEGEKQQQGEAEEEQQWQQEDGKKEVLQWQAEGEQLEGGLLKHQQQEGKLEKAKEQLEGIAHFQEQDNTWDSHLKPEEQTQEQQVEEPKWELQELWEEQVEPKWQQKQILVGEVEQEEEEHGIVQLFTLQQEEKEEEEQEREEHDLSSLLGDT